MKVTPVTSTIPFRMRFKNTDNSNENKQQPNNANPGFKKALELANSQPIKPYFKGHWPMYKQETNEIPQLGKPVVPVSNPKPGTLNFIV